MFQTIYRGRAIKHYLQHEAGQNKSVSKMPTSLSLLLLSAILVLGYSAPKYYLVETKDGLEGIYKGKIRKFPSK